MNDNNFSTETVHHKHKENKKRIHHQYWVGDKVLYCINLCQSTVRILMMVLVK
jgi:hypothetical protein